MRKTMSAIAMAVLVLASATAAAGPVPVSYTFDKATDRGSLPYHDPHYTKLTDGILGYKGWALNSAAPWVGWVQDGAVNIDFTFSGLTAISAVHVGTTQNHLRDVVLPSVNVYQWVSGSWALAGSLTVPPSTANNSSNYDPSPHGFLDVTGLGIYSDKVRVTLLQNGPWIFADEITFDASVQQDKPLPEPRTLAQMAGGLGLLIWARRRRPPAPRGR